MPRVNTRTRTTRGTKTYTCNGCGKTIDPGQTFYTWQRYRSPRQYRHTSCGYPKRTMLSGSKTAILEDAIADIKLDDISYYLPPDIDVDAGQVIELDGIVTDCTDALSSLAEEARSVADEYEEGVENMPQGLQQGSTGEAMRDVAERLREWADALDDGPSSSTTSVDLPDPADHTDDTYGTVDEEAWREAAQAEVDEAVSEIVGEAQGLLDDMPGYEG